MKLLIIFLSILFSYHLFAEDIKDCNCTDGFVEYCKYDETKNFIGFCSNEKGRQIGKTFYEDWTSFEGNYYQDLYSVGTMTWPNGDSLRGEFVVANAGYTLEAGIDSTLLSAIGQFVEGTVTQRGFFEFKGEDVIRLIGFGTEFDTDPEGEFNYRAGSHIDGEMKGSTLVTLKVQAEDQTGGLAIWSDLSLPVEERNLYIINGDARMVYIFENDKSKFLREFNEEDELARAKIETNIETSKKALDKNFDILESRLIQVEDFLSGKESAEKSNPIKPLSSELVRSIQELLTILGYETGKIDGVLGPLTIAGIKAFEKTNEQDLTGTPSDQLLISLQ